MAGIILDSKCRIKNEDHKYWLSRKKAKKKKRQIKGKIVISESNKWSNKCDESDSESIQQVQQVLACLSSYLGMSFFLIHFFSARACIYRKTFMDYTIRTICLDNMGALGNMRTTLCDICIALCEIGVN